MGPRVTGARGRGARDRPGQEAWVRANEIFWKEASYPITPQIVNLERWRVPPQVAAAQCFAGLPEERLVEVCEEVVDMLDPHGHPNEVVRDPAGAALLRRD